MIPAFGLGQVLPPFMGEDAAGVIQPRSPYSATITEFVQHFGTSAERCAILRGLLNYRTALRAAGFTDGFHWIDGSFVEDCEIAKGRPPNDVDVVSLLRRPNHVTDEAGWEQFIDQHASTIFDSAWTKQHLLCDAYYIDLGIDPRDIAEQGAYWFGLFSHQRETFRWKGLVQIELMDDDQGAEARLALLEQGW